MNTLFTYIDTPIGKMIAYSTKTGICLLEFIDQKNYLDQIKKIENHLQSAVYEGKNEHLELLENELSDYFSGNTKKFTVPLDLIGTDFQKDVWNELLNIPFGKTISYKQQAIAIGRPKSVRAVANANGMNKIVIVVPCHRVIGTNGKLTGFASGIERKQYLLNLENNQKDLFSQH